jgi:hypothetical protein
MRRVPGVSTAPCQSGFQIVASSGPLNIQKHGERTIPKGVSRRANIASKSALCIYIVHISFVYILSHIFFSFLNTTMPRPSVSTYNLLTEDEVVPQNAVRKAYHARARLSSPRRVGHTIHHYYNRVGSRLRQASHSMRLPKTS